MCLGIPAKVVERHENIAIVDYGGVTKEVDCSLVPDIKPGEYVIVHAGAIIEKISEKDYEETVEILRELIQVTSNIQSDE